MRIAKYLRFDGDATLTGFTTCTNELSAEQTISPDFFETRWPELYRQRRIWLCGHAAADPDSDGDSYYTLFEQMALVAAAQRGLIGVNFSRLTETAQRIWQHLARRELREVSLPGTEPYRFYPASS